METQQNNVIETLKKLHQLEVDANNAYETAIEHLRDDVIKSNIANFKKDHERHLTEIEQQLTQRNVPIPKRTKDFKGYLIDGMTLLRSAISDNQALKAMKQNEETVYDMYEECYHDMKQHNMDVASMIRKALNDESRHYNYILTCLNEKEGYKIVEEESDFTSELTPNIIDATKPKDSPASLNRSSDFRNLH